MFKNASGRSPQMAIRSSALLALLTLILTTQVHAASCSHLFAGGKPPMSLPAVANQKTAFLCNNDYAVLVSENTKSPLWSAEDLTEEQIEAARQTARTGHFIPDRRLPSSMQAMLSDYHGSGYDRGHMTPSGDEPDTSSQNQSFLLSNIVPQTAALNRGAGKASKALFGGGPTRKARSLSSQALAIIRMKPNKHSA